MVLDNRIIHIDRFLWSEQILCVVIDFFSVWMLIDKYYIHMLHLHGLIYNELGELMNLQILYHKNYTDISFLYVLTEYVHLEYLYVVLYIYILNMDTWNPDELTFYVLLDYSVLLLDNHKLCRDISFLHELIWYVSTCFQNQ